MATVYIANSNVSFEKAFLFNGYLPSTHSGLNDTINEAAPLDVDALIFGGGNDVFLFGVDELADVYQQATVIISSTADHHLPTAEDEVYGDILAFFRQGTNEVP